MVSLTVLQMNNILWKRDKRRRWKPVFQNNNSPSSRRRRWIRDLWIGKRTWRFLREPRPRFDRTWKWSGSGGWWWYPANEGPPASESSLTLMGIANLVVVVLIPFYFFSMKFYSKLSFLQLVLLKFVLTLGKEFNESKSVTVTIAENVTNSVEYLSFLQLKKKKSTILSFFCFCFFKPTLENQRKGLWLVITLD